MALARGTRLGVYEVTAQIGEGGMGQVYRATDTKLKRQVAIKILPPSLAADHDRLARFQREAEVLASLNHPNIAALYGLEESGGMTALVMELVEGDDLSQRIARGAIPIEEAVPIAKQIAEALEAAHEQGIIHRDLKPANVKVRPDGTVKVLDFGLAKAIEPTGAMSQSASMSPTITTPAMTQAGMILGTAAYMSPEQAKGRTIDKRSDVWALGAVVYEMLTGRRAFQGDDVSDTLAAILRGAPDWTALPANTPPAIRRLLRRSLEKDVRARLSDMAMVRVELRDVDYERQESGAVPLLAPPTPSRWRRMAPYAATILVAIVTGFAVWIVMRPVDSPRSLVRFAISLPDGMRLSAPQQPQVAVSPAGTHLVYVANGRLYLRAMDQSDAQAIAGTEAGGATGFARHPFFSPDGQWIAFWQERQLRKVPISGGAPVPIWDSPTGAVWLGASWGPDDEILLGDGLRGILRVRATGGQTEPLITLKEGERASYPQALPGGQWVLFVLHPAGAEVPQGQVVVQSRTTGERRILVEGAHYVRYLSSGHMLYGQGNTVLAQAVDLDRLTLVGGPVPVLDGVANTTLGSPGLHLSVASTGMLLYVPTSNEATTSRLVQVTRDGTRSPLVEIAGMTWFPRFSPDGSRVAHGVSAGTDIGDSGASDLWVLDVTRGARTRVTLTGDNRFYPIWTRDGLRLTYADATGLTNRVLWTLADGSGGTETLVDVGVRRYPTSWSPDGRTLALHVGGPPTEATRDIWMLNIEGNKRTQTPFVEGAFEERGAIFSPNGRWIAYVSNKAGQNDIYARPYPGPGVEVTISVGGGQEPVWGPSGRELFYRRNGRLLAVRLDQAAPSLSVGAPTPLFDDPYRLDMGGAAGGVANYDISPDGKRFVMVEEPRLTNTNATEPVKLHVVQNWHEELNRRVPTK